MLDIDEILDSETYDYNNYTSQKENKVLIDASKILVLSIFLFKVLNSYTPPEWKQTKGAETDFENI